VEKVLRDKKAIALFVLPAFLIFVGVIFVPILWTLVYSLFSGMPGLNFKYYGFQNYIDMFFNKQTVNAIAVNWKYIAIVTPCQVGFGLLAALMVHFSVKKYKTLTRTLIFIPTVLPAVAVAQMFIKMYALTPNYGLFNSILNAVGLSSAAKAWLGFSNTAFTALCLMDVWTAVGFYTVIIYGALVDIPDEIIEAARIDGANSFGLFRRILLPMLKTMITTCFVFSFTGTIKMFESATALTSGGPGQSTTSMTMNMYQNAFKFNEYGYASAVAVVILLQCLLVTLIINRVGKERY
jgi:raffinose/stachyose/melibiose transport system permease protein